MMSNIPDNIRALLAEVHLNLDEEGLHRLAQELSAAGYGKPQRKSMRPPSDFDGLNDDDLEAVNDLISQVEEYFEQDPSPREFRVNTNTVRPFLPERVWEELVRRAREDGWDAELKGAIVSIKRPRRV